MDAFLPKQEGEMLRRFRRQVRQKRAMAEDERTVGKPWQIDGRINLIRQLRPLSGPTATLRPIIARCKDPGSIPERYLNLSKIHSYTLNVDLTRLYPRLRTYFLPFPRFVFDKYRWQPPTSDRRSSSSLVICEEFRNVMTMSV